METIAIKNKLEAGQIFKISRFKELIKKTVPHKHDEYYELIFLAEGEGIHRIEAEKHQISTPECYFLKPGQLHCWQFTAIPKGFVILFKKDFFDPIQDAPMLDLVKKLSPLSQIALPAGQLFWSIFEDAFEVYQRNDAFGKSIIQGYLKVLFSKLLQLSNLQVTKASLSNSLCDKFLDLVQQKTPQLHQVSEYAALLNTTPQNLNAACRKVSQRSASEYISAQILLEAKRYILHSDNSINQIAELLHFNDASYFVKFFKKHTGETPLQFREKYFQ